MPLLWLLTAHLVGDFLLQSNRMAQQKSKHWDALTQHVVVYTAVFLVALSWWRAFVDWQHYPTDMLRVLLFCAVTFIAHFIQDAITSRITSRLWFVEGATRIWDHERQHVEAYVHYDTVKRHWFFVMIGFDQLLHAWQLGLTYRWLYGA